MCVLWVWLVNVLLLILYLYINKSASVIGILTAHRGIVIFCRLWELTFQVSARVCRGRVGLYTRSSVSSRQPFLLFLFFSLTVHLLTQPVLKFPLHSARHTLKNQSCGVMCTGCIGVMCCGWLSPHTEGSLLSWKPAPWGDEGKPLRWTLTHGPAFLKSLHETRSASCWEPSATLCQTPPMLTHCHTWGGGDLNVWTPYYCFKIKGFRTTQISSCHLPSA